MGDIGNTITQKKEQFDAWLKSQSDPVRGARHAMATARVGVDGAARDHAIS